jgi:hypothetical protein
MAVPPGFLAACIILDFCIIGFTPAAKRDKAPPARRYISRKDQLLQQNGYFVLRFLAEDVGKNLNIVPDTIQRTLFCRQK